MKGPQNIFVPPHTLFQKKLAARQAFCGSRASEQEKGRQS